MSLSLYNKKRRFEETPEPEGKSKSSKTKLRFVIQKHDASHVHYDFRLEMGGMLKSWAIPKGPSLNPEDKRLAMMVEDHPYDYRNFEGIIPAGNYGGGTVIVWDEGTYELAGVEPLSRKEQEKVLLQQLESGDLKLQMQGQKIKGLFALFQMKGKGDRTWLLVKKKDEHSSNKDITKEEASVKSGKTLSEVAADHGVELNHPVNKKIAAKKTLPVTLLPEKKTATKKTATKKAATKKLAAKKLATKKMAKPAVLTMNRSDLVDPDAKNEEVNLAGKTLQLTNLTKLYWPKEKFSKGDLVNYYHRIAPFILPYLNNRPHTLNRLPNGITKPGFYQKDIKDKAPDWIKTHEDFSESTDQTVSYLVCTGEASLIYMANLGCLEMHPWHSRTGTWENPDWCLIDLDPSDNNSFDEVIEVANHIKQILDEVGADAYCKTSGSTGIHIYLPLKAKYSYDQSKQLAELIVTMANEAMPDLTSLERSPAKRKGRIYLDYLQNRETQTVVAPYSLRPKPGVPVSTPLHWSELKKGLRPINFTAFNIFDRLKAEGDLFYPVLGKGINLEKVLRNVQSLLK